MDNLTGENETKGKVALVGLYIVATNERDKLNIANIAIQSGKKSLQNTAAFLLKQECTKLFTPACKDTFDILAAAQDENVQAQVSKQDDKLTSASGSPGDKRVVNVKVQSSPVTQALQELTITKISKSDLQGWIYIGKIDESGKFSSDRTTTAKGKPSPGSLYKSVTSVYLRTEGTIRSGSSLGIIPSGQNLKVDAIKSNPLGSGLEAVWAKVTIPKSLFKKSS
ncbi:hypothetical protein KQ313_12400 [Synechococcus sp. CS-1325]|uniref:hypothetical protein n=1 Tax=unclassified Synechococcus TaxID=2626047 RepID=UPI0021A8186E|nr:MULTISPECIES: hypothetical protein [unclassified Synechococcus]MCT0200477.1 hypothetical protein [Synechococcus sp. CS-1325]MCT0232668.1 hypothetical protein [Synechococcus sp. CS-1327]